MSRKHGSFLIAIAVIVLSACLMTSCDGLINRKMKVPSWAFGTWTGANGSISVEYTISERALLERMNSSGIVLTTDLCKFGETLTVVSPSSFKIGLNDGRSYYEFTSVNSTTMQVKDYRSGSDSTTIYMCTKQ